jgi:antitoxin component YwqK of YwqJK toxin-antitoxin module
MDPPPCKCELQMHAQCYADLYFDSSYKLCRLTNKNSEHLEGTDAAKCTLCDQYFSPPNERMDLYDNEVLLYSIGYLNGNLHGSFKEFWPNGQLKKLTSLTIFDCEF